MKVVEILKNAKKPLFSFEIIPPARGKSCNIITDIIEELQQFNPPFIDVTSHCSEAYYEELENGIVKKRIRKKRPGTIGICGVIQNRFNIDTVAHVLCRGFTKEETEDALIELNFLGIKNILALRGDGSNHEKKVDKCKSVNTYASELIEQIVALREGKYIEKLEDSEPMDFCIGVAGYPEKHFESPNLKTDIQNLKLKVDAGADYIVTQMFFDNKHYYNFVDLCREAGINVPIIPGLKIINNVKHLSFLPKYFHVDLPEELVNQIESDPKNVKKIAKNWGLMQVKDLLEKGVKCVHFYVMNDAKMVIDIIKSVK